MACRLREDSLLRLILFLGLLLGSWCTLCSFLRISFGWGLALSTLASRLLLLHVLLADTFAALFKRLLLLLSQFFA